MSPLAILVLSLSMSTDAFAAAVARGAAHRPSLTSTFKAALMFGVIEAITPVVGWALGSIASNFVEQIGHWIAFGLLVAVGGNFIWQALRGGDDDENDSSVALGERNGGLWGLIGTALATSIDRLFDICLHRNRHADRQVDRRAIWQDCRASRRGRADRDRRIDPVWSAIAPLSPYV